MTAHQPEPSLIPPDPDQRVAECDRCRGTDWQPTPDGGWGCVNCGAIYSRDGVLVAYWSGDDA